MLQNPALSHQIDKYAQPISLTLIILETVLVLLALVPAQLWTRIFPTEPNAAFDGPFPATLAPIVTLLLYLTPTVIGFLCRDWKKALLYATIPAWLGLGIFLITATTKVGAFYFVSADHATSNASILELFAALGCIGWLGRALFKLG
ncbi:MAG TPA: hypothetical protein VL461_01480 [Dictyobacter sp.]|jgi:hypothetical protein|nr:hypothetical protein [Dictyobacter sp.]